MNSHFYVSKKNLLKLKRVTSHFCKKINMKQSDKMNDYSIPRNSQKLIKLYYLLQNTKLMNTEKLNPKLEKPLDLTSKFSVAFSKELSLYLSMIEKPINLLFSMDQFLFEFSKKTYQQKKVGEFFQQLKERKKLSLFYGNLNRKYLVTIFNRAKNNKGSFVKNVFCLLERRLDIVLYRSGFTKTIAEARQYIRHKKILINHRPVNFPAYLVEPGDIISIQAKTGLILKQQLSNPFKMKAVKNHPKIFGDFYSKLKKNLNKPVYEKKLEINPDIYRSSLRSRMFFVLFIKLLCVQIKARTFWNLKKKPLIENSQGSSLLLNKGMKLLGLFKWKSLSSDNKLKSLSLRSKIKLFGKNSVKFKMTNGGHCLLKNGGGVPKKPLFWNRNIMNSKYKKNRVFKNQKTAQPYQKTHHIWKQKHGKKINLLEKYRYCFLHFIKFLDNYKKFTSLLHLNVKKSLYKKNFYKRKPGFQNSLNFRVMKPMHLEISYKLLNIIYLYSPQRLNYPFSIDLDVINRSFN